MKSIVHGLETKIHTILSKPITDTRSAIIACSQLEALYKKSKDADSDIAEKAPEDARKLLSQVLAKTTPSGEDLKEFFVSSPKPSPEAVIMALDGFNKAGQVLPTKTAMIPFREATYNCEFDTGFKLLDRIAGLKSNMDSYGDSKIRKFALGWSTGVCGILAGVDQLLASGLVGNWDANKNMVLGMVFAYIGAVSTYGVLALGGRNNERFVNWVPGTPIGYRFKFRPQLDMASTLAQMNAALPENQGECAPKMTQELKDRHMFPLETRDEESIKEYWARGGEGFDWVEPDQDPAEIIWRQKMDALAQKRIGSPYVRKENGLVQNWAQSMLNIEENRTIPHASLIDIEALRGPEKMAELEKELKKLKENLNNPESLSQEQDVNGELPAPDNKSTQDSEPKN